MGKVNFMDTSVMLELLNVPDKSSCHEKIKNEYQELSVKGDTFVLPLATLIETGNHIAHIQNANARRKIAIKFSELVSAGINSISNWNIYPQIPLHILANIIKQFPDKAAAKIGIGDISILSQFKDYWENKQPIGEMRLWSTDTHLQGYTYEGGLNRRKNK